MTHVVPSVRHSVYLQTQISDASTVRSWIHYEEGLSRAEAE